MLLPVYQRQFLKSLHARRTPALMAGGKSDSVRFK